MMFGRDQLVSLRTTFSTIPMACSRECNVSLNNGRDGLMFHPLMVLELFVRRAKSEAIYVWLLFVAIATYYETLNVVGISF